MKRVAAELPLWQDAFDAMCGAVVPLKQRPVPHDERHLPQIVNCVSTAVLLPQGKGYKLPLEEMSLRLGSCCLFNPTLFAALIVKLADHGTESTALVFSTGNVVVVSALTPEHTRYASQVVRHIAEQIECVLVGDDRVPFRGSLVGRTIFSNSCIHNIVGHGDLGHRIDLRKMCETAPTCCKWAPDSFPGLKSKIWLTKEHKCVCSARGADPKKVEPLGLDVQRIIGKQSKCVCSVKVLLFDTGKFVITGARRVRDVNSVYFRIITLAPAFAASLDAPEGALPMLKEDRFYERLAAMMVPRVGVALDGPARDMRRLPQKQLDTTEALSRVFAAVSKRQPQGPSAAGRRVESTAGRLPVLHRFALDGRVQEVRMLVQLDPMCVMRELDDEGRTALVRIKAIPVQDRMTEHDQVIHLLETLHVGGTPTTPRR